MRFLLALLLALCTVLSVHCAVEVPCVSPNCDCDPSKYNESVTPPEATIECRSGQMIIYISKCQLQKSKFDISNLALNSNTGTECNSVEVSVNNEPQIAFHNPMSFGKCGNNITLNSTHVIFSNILNIYVKSSNIITRNNASAAVSCIYPLSYTVNLNTTLHPKLTTAQITIPGVIGALTVVMTLYTDETFTKQITDENSQLTVESYVYVGFNIPDLEANTFSIKVIRIYASAAASGEPIYNLTNAPDGCPDPSLGSNIILPIRNGNGSEARFRMQVFKIANSDNVILFAQVTICPAICVVTCTGRTGKSDDVSTSQDVATLQIPLSATQTDYSGATDRFSKTTASMLIIPSLLFLKYM